MEILLPIIMLLLFCLTIYQGAQNSDKGLRVRKYAKYGVYIGVAIACILALTDIMRGVSTANIIGGVIGRIIGGSLWVASFAFVTNFFINFKKTKK